MRNPTRIPDSQISGSEGIPADSRPGKPGWNPAVPTSPAQDEPELIIDLTPSEKVPSVPLDSIKLTSNLKKVTILVKTGKDEPFKVSLLQHFILQGVLHTASA